MASTERGGFLRDDTTKALVVKPVDSFTLTPANAAQAIVITPSGAVSASTSVGGAVNITNTASTGAGLVIYSNNGATQAGRLLALRTSNAAFAQAALSVNYMGSASAIQVIRDNAASETNSRLLDITDNNPADTTLGISGNQSGRGLVKLTHKKPDGVADANASAISIVLDRENAAEASAAQGIFLDSTHVTTGKLIQLKNNGGARFDVLADGQVLGGVGGVATRTKAGTPADADFTVTPPIGMIILDTTADKIWCRTAAATWKGVVIA